MKGPAFGRMKGCDYYQSEVEGLREFSADETSAKCTFSETCRTAHAERACSNVPSTIHSSSELFGRIYSIDFRYFLDQQLFFARKRKLYLSIEATNSVERVSKYCATCTFSWHMQRAYKCPLISFQAVFFRSLWRFCSAFFKLLKNDLVCNKTEFFQ